MITFALREVDEQWQVDEVSVEEGGRARAFHRGDSWTLAAGMEDVAAVVAVLILRRGALEHVLLRSDLGPGERALVRRYSNILRSIKPRGEHWSVPVFSGLSSLKGFIRSPLENLLRVSGHKATTIVPLKAFDETSVRFTVESLEASEEELRRFALSRLRPARRGRTPAPLNVPPLVVAEHDWEVLPSLEPDAPEERDADSLLFGPSRRVQERVKRDNPSSRLQLALLGSREGRTDIDNQVIDSLMDGLAQMLVAAPVHVIVGPIGIGLELLEKAINQHGGAELTYSLVVGPSRHLFVAANAVLIVGGGGRTSGEANAAFAAETTLLPLRSTGGAAAESWQAIHDGKTRCRLRDEYMEGLGAADPEAVVRCLTGLLTLIHQWNVAHPPRLQLQGGEYRFSRA